MGTLNRLDYRDRIYDMGDDRGPQRRWSSTEIDFWRRRGEIDVGMRTQYLLQLGTIAGVAGLPNYVLPADYMQYRMVAYIEGTDWRVLKYREIDDFFRRRIVTQTETGTPEIFTVRVLPDSVANQHTLWSGPAPVNPNGTFYIFYWRAPRDLTTDSTQTELPTHLEALPIFYALSNVLERIDVERAQYWDGKYKREITEAMMFAKPTWSGDEYIRDPDTDVFSSQEAALLSRVGTTTSYAAPYG